MTEPIPCGPMDLPEMTPGELRDRLERDHPIVLVDVREPHEREIADLPERGQKRIPVGDFAERVGDLPSDANLVLYCRSGARSAWAVRQLLQHGFENVWNLKGGVMGWRAEVDPTLPEY